MPVNTVITPTLKKSNHIIKGDFYVLKSHPDKDNGGIMIVMALDDAAIGPFKSFRGVVMADKSSDITPRFTRGFVDNFSTQSFEPYRGKLEFLTD